MEIIKFITSNRLNTIFTLNLIYDDTYYPVLCYACIDEELI